MRIFLGRYRQSRVVNQIHVSCFLEIVLASSWHLTLLEHHTFLVTRKGVVTGSIHNRHEYLRRHNTPESTRFHKPTPCRLIRATTNDVRGQVERPTA